MYFRQKNQLKKSKLKYPSRSWLAFWFLVMTSFEDCLKPFFSKSFLFVFGLTNEKLLKSTKRLNLAMVAWFVKASIIPLRAKRVWDFIGFDQFSGALSTRNIPDMVQTLKKVENNHRKYFNQLLGAWSTHKLIEIHSSLTCFDWDWTWWLTFYKHALALSSFTFFSYEIINSSPSPRSTRQGLYLLNKNMKKGCSTGKYVIAYLCVCTF